MSYFTKRTTRIVAGTLVGALALSVSPMLGLTGIASAADALPPIAEPIGDGNFCEDAPTTEPFTDVSDTDPSRDEIICLVATGLTKGTTPTTYSPNNSITRRQMALFIKRTADLANTLDTGTNIAPLPAYDGTPDFLDIAGESAEAKEAIGQLVQAGIVQGTTATTYSPGGLVSRRQMAAFVNRLQDFLTGDPFTTTKDFFNDDAGDSGEANLNAVASVGIFQGDGAGNVNPGGPLTRRQMANVLLRHAQVLFDAGDIKRAFPEDDGNQAFASTPTASTTAVWDPVSGNGAPVTVGVSGLDATRDYDVTLVPCSDYSGPSVTNNGVNVLDENGVSSVGGTIGFSDQPVPNDIADDEPSTMYGNATILSIGFTNIGSTSADDISPEADGTLSIRVGTSGGSDCVHVVVYDDNADDDNLDLGGAAVVENDNTPTDKFTITGAITWTAGDAPTGTAYNDDCVVFLNKTANTFILGSGYSFTYGDAGDTYWYSSQHGGGQINQVITLAEFEAALSLGDCLDNDNSGSSYTRTGSNVFEISHDNRVNTPSAPTAVVANLDADPAPNDVTFTWTDPNPGADIDQYRVRIRNATTGASISTHDTTEVNTVGGGDAPLTLTVNDLADGSYVATISSDSENEQGFFDEGPFSATFLVGAAADVTRPGITDARVTTDAGLQDRFDAGDVVTLTFTEAMNASTAASGSFVLTDADGDTFNLTCGAVTATCVLGDGGTPLTPNDTLVITVTAGIADTNVAGNGVLNMPANITTTNADVADAAGNVVNLANPPSTDVAIDKEP